MNDGHHHNECQSRMLSDAPAIADLLLTANEPFARLAASLASQIADTNNDGKFIALSGAWGSGKSTILQLLQFRLAEHVDVSVVSFDAWGHEGDSLRRSFLSTLIHSLHESEWLNIDRRDFYLRELEEKRTETQTNHQTTTTPYARCVAAAATLVPLGTTITSRALQDNKLTFAWLAPLHIPTTIGMLLATAPLLVAALWCAYSFMWKRKPLSESLRFFEPQQGRSTRETSVTSSVDHSSLRFETIFRNILTEVTADSPNRRITIIIDNLDRVSTRSQQTIWSTLSIFLQPTAPSTTQWRRATWSLVPIARGPQSTADPDDSSLQILPAPTADTTDRQNTAAIEKLFQLVIPVPAIDRSSWRSLLRQYLEHNLPRHPAVEITTAITVFDRYRGQEHKAPTPRELKIFSNRLSQLHAQWEHTYNLPELAYYAVRCDSPETFGEALRRKLEPTDGHEAFFLPGFRERLAALTYHSAPENGAALLLGETIEATIFSPPHATEQQQELTRLAQDYGPTFWVAVDHHLCGNHLISAVNVSAAINNIIKLRDNASEPADSQRLHQHVLETLTRQLIATLSTSLSPPIAWAIKTALDCTDDQSLIRALKEAVAGLFPIPSLTRPSDVKNFLNSISILIEHLRAAGAAPPDARYALTSSCETLNSLAPTLKSIRIPSSHLSSFVSSPSVDALDHWISQKIPLNNLAVHWETIALIRDAGIPAGWQECRSKYEELVQQGSSEILSAENMLLLAQIQASNPSECDPLLAAILGSTQRRDAFHADAGGLPGGLEILLLVMALRSPTLTKEAKRSIQKNRTLARSDGKFIKMTGQYREIKDRLIRLLDAAEIWPGAEDVSDDVLLSTPATTEY